MRNREGDDDDEDGEKGSDSDTANETVEVDIQGSGRIPLSFQERSLREYFQAVDVDEKGLRTPPSAAHLTIFEMAAELVLNTRHELKRSDQPKLLSYAASFWAQHFMEIDLSKASEDVVKRVVSALHKILNNENNVSRTFEHFAEVLYSTMTPENDGLWLSKVKEWTSHASNSPGLLPPKVDTWAYYISRAINKACTRTCRQLVYRLQWLMGCKSVQSRQRCIQISRLFK